MAYTAHHCDLVSDEDNVVARIESETTLDAEESTERRIEDRR